jgi:hypothetical protein
MTNVETDTSLARLGDGMHHSFDFGRTCDNADADSVLVDVASHEPILSLYQALPAIGGLKGIESIWRRSNQRGSVCAALCKLQEWAFDMPAQQMRSSRRRPWSQEMEQLWVE